MTFGLEEDNLFAVKWTCQFSIFKGQAIHALITVPLVLAPPRHLSELAGARRALLSALITIISMVANAS